MVTLASVDGGDPHLTIRKRDTDRAQRVRAVAGEGRSQPGDLGHAPQLDERTTEATLDLLHLGDRHGLAADRAAGERGDVVAIEVGMRQHVHVHRRHALEHRGPVCLNAGQHFGGIETRMQHERETEHHRAVEDDIAVDVRAGQCGDDRVSGRLGV